MGSDRRKDDSPWPHKVRLNSTAQNRLSPSALFLHQFRKISKVFWNRLLRIWACYPAVVRVIPTAYATTSKLVLFSFQICDITAVEIKLLPQGSQMTIFLRKTLSCSLWSVRDLALKSVYCKSKSSEPPAITRMYFAKQAFVWALTNLKSFPFRKYKSKTKY